LSSAVSGAADKAAGFMGESPLPAIARFKREENKEISEKGLKFVLSRGMVVLHRALRLMGE